MRPSSRYGQSTPNSKQHQALVPSIFAPWIFGGAVFNWSHCVLRVLSDTWALRCVMVMFCVKEADWGTMALVAYNAPWVSECLSACAMHSATRKQHPCPSNARHWFRQFQVIYGCLDNGGGGGRYRGMPTFGRVARDPSLPQGSW